MQLRWSQLSKLSLLSRAHYSMRRRLIPLLFKVLSRTDLCRTHCHPVLLRHFGEWHMICVAAPLLLHL